MKVEFVYKFFPIILVEYDGIRNKCVTSYGPVIFYEKYGKYSVCAEKIRLHKEYAKQFYRTFGFRPLLCLSQTTSIDLDVEVHARQLVEHTAALSPAEFNKAKANRAKMIWSLSAKRNVTTEQIQQQIEDRIKTLTQKENKNESKTD